MCNRCGYESKYKKCLVQHLNNKVQCKCIDESKDIDRQHLLDELTIKKYNDEASVCDFCEKKFNCKSSMYRHKKICKKKPAETTEQLFKMQQQIDKQQEQIEQLKKQAPSNVINNNTQNNINITVPKLKNFGWENMDAIPESLVSSLFMNLRFKELLANLHCDPNFPENQNIRIKSVKRNTMEIFRNNKWDIVTFTKGLTDLLLQGHRIFTDYYNKDKKRILEEDMDEQDLREILSQLQKIQDLNKSEIKPLIEDLQMMLEEYRENGHAIVLA
jgi:hypothetical protein